MSKVPRLLNRSKSSFHRKKRMDMYSFEGYMACGGVSYVLYDYMRENGIGDDIRFMLSSYGSGKYKEDHLYLKIDNLIIDGTYKQFMYDYDKSGKYMDYLFSDMPMVYIGEDINDLYDSLNIKYKEYNGNNMSKLDLKFWCNSLDITESIMLKKD